MESAIHRISGALPASGGVPLARLASLLGRHAPLIIGLAVVGAVGAYGYARTLPKHYTASSLIAVEGDRFAIPELQGALRAESAADPMPVVRTEMQALTSRDIMQVVVTKLKLAENPEFNSDLRPPTLMQAVKAYVQSLLPTSPELQSDAGPNEGVLNAFSSQLKIFQDNRSLAIEVSFTSEDPKLSAEAVNSLILEYIAAQARRRSSANEGANKAMTDRIAQVSSDVAALEKQMMDLRNSNDMVNLRAGSVGQQQLEELATAAARAAIERSQLESTYDRASALAKQGSSDALSTVLNSPTIAQMREQEATASRRAAELSSRYGSGYPGVRSAQADLAAARGQLGAETQRIVSSLGTQLKAAQAHEADVKRQLAEARTLAVQSENARARLDQLQQEVVTRRSLYKTLLERAQQTVNQPVGTQTPDVHVVSTAAPPGGPSGPNMKIAGGLGGAAGGILGCLLALTRLGRMERQIPSGQLADISGVQIASSMPEAFLRRSRGKIGDAVLAEPQGAQARAIRALRDRVRRLGDPTTPSIVMVTSSAQDEDALQIALACGRVAAGDGERVLLIDGNFAAPRVARLLGNGSTGLGAFFHSRADWRDLVMEDPSTALDLLASQEPASDPVEQICSTQFQNLLVEAADDFDLVLVVAPAATSESARAMAQRVDAVLVVVDSQTTKPVLQRISAQFEKLSRRRLALIELQA